MKKLFTLIASALFAVGASAQIDNPVDVKATWDLSEGVATAVVSPAAAAQGDATMTLGDGFVFYKKDEVQQFLKYFDVTFTTFAPVDADHKGDNKYSSVMDKYVDFTFTPSDLFAMKSVSFDVVKIGTGDPAIFVDIIDGEGATTHLKDNAAIEIRKSSDETGVDVRHTYEVTTSASSKAVTLRINFGKLADNKQVGLANVVIEGTIKGDNIEVGGDEGKGDENPGGDEGNDNPGEGEGELIASWDFTKWSEATVNALKADAANWSDDEKDNGTTVDGKCFWNVAGAAVVGDDGSLKANGEAIEEFKGLKFEGTPAKRALLAIGVDYGVTSIGKYEGGAYFWLAAKGDVTFTIPGVPGGSVIKIGVESHKNLDSDPDARGVKLDGATTTDELPVTYEVQTWKVPGDAAVDVKVQDTAGCHLYFIEVAEGTADDDTPGEGEGGETGIQQVAAKSGNSVIINLAGQKVDSNYKGIVIKDGKKYVQK